MKHYHIVPESYKPPRQVYYVKQKHLTNPTVDVISVVALAVVLVVARLTAGF